MSNRPTTTSAIRNKLIIRRLPPLLPEAVFWNSAASWINNETCLWKRYVPGIESDARTVYSRAYVLMASTEALVDLHRGFDGHIFRSKSGAEFQAVVEFAPYQKTPFKAKVRPDARQATIDDDPDYKSFLETLATPLTKPTLETTAPTPQPTSTPLLDHLRATAKISKGKGKGKQKPRDAALASVSTAAAKRTPPDSVMMVAGKGRKVVITPKPDSKVDDSKNKRPKKKKAAESSVVKPDKAEGAEAVRGASRGGGDRGRVRVGGPGRPTPEQPVGKGDRSASAVRGRRGGRGRGGREGPVTTHKAAEARIDM